MIKRGMKAAVCCTALMGMLIFDMLPVQAAGCEHKICYAYEDVKMYYFKEDGHYGDCGEFCIYADCGYEFWRDLHYQKIEDHQWSDYVLTESTAEKDVFEAHCTRFGCDYRQVRTYDKNP